MKRRLILLGMISLVLVLNRPAESDESPQPLTPCRATVDRHRLDGKQIAVSGRYYLNPIVSNDAPDLLGNIYDCLPEDDAQPAVLVSFKHLSHSNESNVFQKYREDLVPVQCPPKTTCLPPKVARYLYVDVVAVGRFAITNKTGRGYCCTLDVQDILSTQQGPLNRRRSPAAGRDN